jgi:penicillin-binding protein 1B
VTGAGPRRGPSPRSGLAAWTARLVALVALISAFAFWGWLAVAGAGSDAVRALQQNPADAPVEVLSAPTLLRPGAPVDLAALARQLAALGYRPVSARPRAPGEYRRQGTALEIWRRAHLGPDGPVAQGFVRVEGGRGGASTLTGERGAPVRSFALEPVRLGAFRGPVLMERRPLGLKEFPLRLVQAVLAAEDARYLDHGGVDPVGVARAAWHNVVSDGPLQGGSTITQQVIKNRVVGADRTVERKLREALLAAYVEQKVTKERILEIYLNEVYLGQRGPVSVVGMPAGALFYFGKNVRELALPEMAVLAALIASPGRFDPRTEPEAALGRRDWVLRRMAEVGFIDRDAARAAAAAPLAVAPVADPLDPAGDVLDAVRRELRLRGIEPQPGPEQVSVHTTIDPALQEAARHALDGALTELEAERPSRRPLEGAVVVLDPANGALRALVGGRAGTRGSFNRALDARRQPGSAFKPFVALAAFEERGSLPSTVLVDEPLTLETTQGPWSPQNFDREFRGPVTVRQALEQSLNVPMVRLGLEVGARDVAAWARRAGFSGSLPAGPAIALGTGETTPLELAGAYATLAASGRPRAGWIVTRVNAGPAGAPRPLRPVPPPAATGVDAIPAWLVLDAMTGSPERGTARKLAPLLAGTRVAAKTGTTQGGRDAWFVLVTGRAVVVAWVGRDDSGPADLTGAGGALPVAARLLEEVPDALLAPLPGPPAGVIEVMIDPETSGLAGERCPTQVREVVREGQEPAPCRTHRSFWQKLFGGFRSGRGDGQGRR